MYRKSINKYFGKDRKILYIILSIVLFFSVSLTVVYAILNVTLNITGTTEVIASTWDIHFDNIQITPGSIDANTSPKIIDSKTIDFAVTLNKPGDYYRFTVDIVNDGSIDAMIDSVVKTPNLTATQTKYIKYEIEYADGVDINKKQLLSKNKTKTLSVNVMYRTDLTSTDLPNKTENLSLSFTLVYTQSNMSAEEIIGGNNISSSLKVLNGDLYTIGSEVSIGDEHFYIIATDEENITMFAKYNLHAGNFCSSSWHTSCTPYGQNATYRQSSQMLGWTSAGPPYNGTIEFSKSKYWSNNTSQTYIYNSDSSLYDIVEKYKMYHQSLGIDVKEARLISIEDLIKIGCSETNCLSTNYNWLYSSSYWTGTALGNNEVYHVASNGYIGNNRTYDNNYFFGIRPVIKIPK